MTHWSKKILLTVVGFVLMMTATAFTAEKTSEEVKAHISREQARQTAIQHIKNGRIVDERFRDRWFRDDDYEFIIVDESNRYRILVDAKTGIATQAKSQAIFTDLLSESERNRLAMEKIVPITVQDVRKIAMNRAPDAVITRIERHMTHDNVTYTVEMGGPPDTNLYINMTIDGKTSDIIFYEETQYVNG